MGKYLDKQGVGILWEATKKKVGDEISSKVTSKINAANGIAGLDSTGKLSSTLLPALKTVNGESIIGSGNIAIDLSIYTIVDSLPESNQNPNKIYLVLTKPATGQEQDIYTEYAWINNKWEKFGEYRAEVTLDGYLQTANLDTEIGKLNKFVTFNDIASAAKAGVIKLNYVTNDKKYKVEVDGEGNAFVAVPWTDTTYKAADGSNNGLMSSTHYTKLEGIEAQATKDEAITDEELAEILV